MQLANLTGNKIVYTLDNMGNRTSESNLDPTNTVQKTKIYLLLIYPKSKKDSLNAEETAVLRALVKEL
jgi:hypothetical protein